MIVPFRFKNSDNTQKLLLPCNCIAWFMVEISKIPSESGYFLKVKLQNGLATTYNRKLNYKPEMTGIAEVVTEDLRLIERVFNNFRKILDR